MKVSIYSLSRGVRWLSLRLRKVQFPALPLTSSEILGKLLTADGGCRWKDDTAMGKASKIEMNIRSLLKIWPGMKKTNQTKTPKTTQQTKNKPAPLCLRSLSIKRA